MRTTAITAALLLLSIAAVAAERSLHELAKAMRHHDPEVREKAVSGLTKTPGRTSLLLLLAAVRDEDAGVRDRARRALRQRKSGEDLGLLAEKGMGHRDPRVRLAALEALAGAKTKGIPGILAEAIEDRDPGVREAAARHMGQVHGCRGERLLAAAALRGREGRPRAEALLGLAARDPAAAREIAIRSASDDALEMRVAAIEVLGADTPEALVEALGDPSWSVRLTAICCLSAAPRGEVVTALIGSLGRERGRVAEEVVQSLTVLTGVGLSPDAKRWEEWWRKNREEFVFPDSPAPEEWKQEESVATFHSIPVRTECVAFVLDRSGSMRDRITRGEETTKGELVSAELAKTFARLKDPARFALIAFRDEPEVFTPRPVKATGMARKKALEWFGKIRPSGRTNLVDSVFAAIDMEEVDTIFLLTDGAPSAGEYRTRTDLLIAIQRKNRYRKAVIHTIEIGGEAIGKRWRGFLRAVSAPTGGIHVSR